MDRWRAVWVVVFALVVSILSIITWDVRAGYIIIMHVAIVFLLFKAALNLSSWPRAVVLTFWVANLLYLSSVAVALSSGEGFLSSFLLDLTLLALLSAVAFLYFASDMAMKGLPLFFWITALLVAGLSFLSADYSLFIESLVSLWALSLIFKYWKHWILGPIVLLGGAMFLHVLSGLGLAYGLLDGSLSEVLLVAISALSLVLSFYLYEASQEVLEARKKALALLR